MCNFIALLSFVHLVSIKTKAGSLFVNLSGTNGRYKTASPGVITIVGNCSICADVFMTKSPRILS